MFLTNNPFSDHGPSKQVLSEAFKYHIPEDIPANERTAFHGAAAAAAKAGKKNFNFGGKTHPVTMKKDTAKSIPTEALDKKDVKTVKGVIKGLKKAVATHSGQVKTLTKDIKDDVAAVKQNEPLQKKLDKLYGPKKDTKKESTMTFREKLVSLYEGDRAAHYKGATKPEEYDEKQKSSKGAMDMLKTPRSIEADGMKAAKDTADNIKKSAPGKKMRPTDKNVGDLAIKPSATPVKDPAAKMQTAEATVNESKDHPHQEAMSDHESQAREHKDNRFNNPKTSGKHHMAAYHAHMDAADHLEYKRMKEAKASAKKAVFHAKKAKELGGEDLTTETNRIFKKHHSSTSESYGVSGNKVSDSLLDAVSQVTDKK